MKDIITTCGCYLIYEGNMLIVHPTNHHYDDWGIPKGIPDKYELHEDAMYREVYEETNIPIADYKHRSYDIGYEHYKNKNKNKRLHGFIVELIEYDYPDIFCASTFISYSDIIQPEVDAFQWVLVDDAINIIQPEQSNLLKRYLNTINK